MTTTISHNGVVNGVLEAYVVIETVELVLEVQLEKGEDKSGVGRSLKFDGQVKVVGIWGRIPRGGQIATVTSHCIALLGGWLCQAYKRTKLSS